MKRFKIDEKHFSTVKVYIEWTQDGVEWATTYHVDHPSFAALRDMLESQGYISTKRNQINGDKVLTSFYLNDRKFMPGDSFHSAGSICHVP